MRADDEALKWFTRLETPPDDSQFCVGLGEALLRALWNRGLVQSSRAERRPPTSELLELKRVVQRALALDSGNPKAHVLRGEVLVAQGELPEAAKAFDRALAYSEAKHQGKRSNTMTARGSKSGAVLVAALMARAVGVAAARDGEWTDIKLVSGVNSPFLDWGPCLSPDGRELYFASDRPPSEGGQFNMDLWVATRSNLDEPFVDTNVELLEDLSSPWGDEANVCFSSDGLTVYFASDRAEGRGGFDIYKATRSGVEAPWDDVTNGEELEEINTGVNELDLTISADGLVAVFDRGPLGATDLYIAERQDPTDAFGGVRPIESLNGEFTTESNPSLTPDGLTLFFADYFGGTRQGSHGLDDLWLATRTSRDQPFGEPQNLGRPLNTVGRENAPFIWGNWPHEEATLYFGRETNQIWQATWKPARRFLRGDCNTDGTVNISDAICALNWLFAGDSAPGCRAALNTNGDQEVDIADSVFLLGFLFGGDSNIAAPFPDCGPGMLPADEELGCANPPDCQ